MKRHAAPVNGADFDLIERVGGLWNAGASEASRKAVGQRQGRGVDAATLEFGQGGQRRRLRALRGRSDPILWLIVAVRHPGDVAVSFSCSSPEWID
jgi:hypothetical protein